MTSLGIIVGPKGRGSNMLAIAEACRNHLVPANVGIVIAPKPDAPGLVRAAEAGLKTEAVPYAPEDSYGERLMAALEGCEIVCLSGYLRLLPLEVLRAYPDRILNIHPSLLPEFGGKGMYGHHVHEAVIAAGSKESGATVHFVNERYDEGQILHQRRVAVAPDETPETLSAKVLEQEHIAYPEALYLLIQSLEEK